MKFLLTSLSILFLNIVAAQSSVIFTNAQTVDEDRYEGFDGDPYQFKEWRLVNIYDQSGLAFEKLYLNINGYSNEIEIREKDRFIELDQRNYTKIESVDEDRKLILKRDLDGKFENYFVEILYEGNKYLFVRKFRTEVTEKEFNDVGKTIKIKRFDPKFNYFILRDGTMEEIKLKKKVILNYFQQKKEIEKFISSNNLKLTKPYDLAELIQHLDVNN